MESLKNISSSNNSPVFKENNLIGFRISNISVNVKIKKQKCLPAIDLHHLSNIKLEDSFYTGDRPHFPSPKKKRKKIKIVDDLSTEDKQKENNQNNNELQTVVEEKYGVDTVDIGTIPYLNPEEKYLTHKGNHILFNGKILDSDTSQLKFQFPSSFKTKKYTQKKQSFSGYPSEFYNKFFVSSNKTKAEKLEKLLKLSTTPSSNFKSPQYIKHKSYKEGYYKNKIDRFLKKIRGNRSKSSLNHYPLEKSNLTLNIY